MQRMHSESLPSVPARRAHLYDQDSGRRPFTHPARGSSMTMALVREQYWVPRLRQSTRKVIKSCYGCRRFQGKAVLQPPPGMLPADRTDGSRPFETIGVDYAGPIKYVKKRKEEGLLGQYISS